MFSIEQLNLIRDAELHEVLPRLRNAGKILELGGGTGVQAKRLSDAGCDVVSVDVPDSSYASNRVFPVIDYDGYRLPFADNSFDTIFSSNVLEHIPHLESFHSELVRVLRPGGECIHIMPTGAWRFWTSVAHYMEFTQRVGHVLWKSLPRSSNPKVAVCNLRTCCHEAAGLARAYIIPPRHGDKGNCLTEIYFFSRSFWIAHFKRNGYHVEEVIPMRLFYTGHMVLGAQWSTQSRRKASRVLGSACMLYRVRPSNADRA